jgi:phage terminase large subunit-like protein
LLLDADTLALYRLEVDASGVVIGASYPDRGWALGKHADAVIAQYREWGVWYDDATAQRAVRFIERYCVHTKGEWAGKPFLLEPWQRDEIMRPLFGWLREDGSRRFRTAYIEIPRKNGKSELGAAVALYLLFADKEPGAEVYSAARDREQASIVFNVARDMCALSPRLAQLAKIIDSRKRILMPTSGSVYRAIPAEEAGLHGLNTSGCVFDELHTQPNRALWDVLTTSTGARRQPLTFTITTAGTDRHSICYEQHEYAEKVAKGIVLDSTYFGYIRSADAAVRADPNAWLDEAVWHLANPALGVFRKIDEMREMAKRALATPALENTFKRLYLNIWTSQETRWLQMHAWDACAQPVEIADRAECYAGLDLASTTDIAALALVFPDKSDPVQFDVQMHYWLPKENIAERVRRDRVPYDVWARQGLVTLTEGNVIDYTAIERDLDTLAQRYRVREVAYDRWGATELIQRLQDGGLEVVPFGQGFASMSPPTKELLNLVLSHRLRHSGDAVSRWMADNLVVSQDSAGNLKPDKRKSTEKIDGMVALIMAIDRASRRENTDSVYEERGLLVL